jgi:hypothetical protein
MRARNIKPGLFKNEVLGTANPLLTLLFAGLWCIADRDGRLEDRPLRIKAELFPYREIPDIDGLLTQLESMGFLHRYKMNDAPVIEVLNFKKHQSPHHTEKKSQLPAPMDSPLSNGEYRESDGEYPPDSLIPDSLIQTPPSELNPSSDQALAASPQKTAQPSQEANRLAQFLKTEIRRNKPDYRITPAHERNWSQTADRMIRLDKRDPRRIAELIRWAQQDEFWMTNILSMEKLREKFDALELKAGGYKKQSFTSKPVSAVEQVRKSLAVDRAEVVMQ